MQLLIFSCDARERHFASKADLMKHNKATHNEAGKELVNSCIFEESFISCFLKGTNIINIDSFDNCYEPE